MDHEPSRWGIPKVPLAGLSCTPSTKKTPTTHTTDPIVTGTSVIAVKYSEGVMMAADCLGSYGSLARFRDIPRLNTLSPATLIGTSGDISDQQYILGELELEGLREACHADGHGLGPRHWHTLLQTIQYQRRSKFDPLWNAHIVGGVESSGEAFLGFVDLKGTSYLSASIATGFGAHLAQPLLREAVEAAEREGRGLTEAEAVALLERCMRLLYCRDARALDRIQVAKATRDGVTVSAPYKIETDWSIA